MKLKRIINKIVELYKKTDPEKYARSLGVKIGKNCVVGNAVWGSEPYLISLGDHVLLSFEVAFVTHDASHWCFKDEPGYEDVKQFGSIRVGNNVFIGCRSTILRGVTIGDNSIIGACSLVNKDIPAGEVWAGVPARYITTTEEYKKRCLANQIDIDLINYKKNKRAELERVFWDIAKTGSNQ